MPESPQSKEFSRRQQTLHGTSTQGQFDQGQNIGPMYQVIMAHGARRFEALLNAPPQGYGVDSWNMVLETGIGMMLPTELSYMIVYKRLGAW